MEESCTEFFEDMRQATGFSDDDVEHNIQTPFVGMGFDSSEEAKEYYEKSVRSIPIPRDLWQWESTPSSKESNSLYTNTMLQTLLHEQEQIYLFASSQEILDPTRASYKIFLAGIWELGKKISCITPGEVVNEDAPSESAPCASRDDPSFPSAPCASSDDPSLPLVLLDPPVSRTKGRPGKKDDASQGKHGRYLDPMEEQGSTSMVEGAEDLSNK
ncbi:hypothetical protein IFM89_021206 [Coptis chinensis]|uniref:Uncharacterized protein n=1 Tax=Coptis chinensis TaxID=261450 RepID=A0A835HE90_9MAGN|nr:hypothetical protein IFM89_021206 [Coptis chinensis]